MATKGMVTFEFTSPEGKTYELEGPEGSTKEQAFQKFQEMRPELFGVKERKGGFVERFGETFQPKKAITEEGIVPQLYKAGKRMVTGEKTPKAEEPAEQVPSVTEAFKGMVKFAKQDPGGFAGTVANAIVADPELLFLPEFLPARIMSAAQQASKVGYASLKTADAATKAGATAYAQSAARQLAERGTVDQATALQEARNAASIAAGTRVVGEAGRAALPGVKRAPSPQREMLEEAGQRGYTLPARALSPIGAVIDRFYKTPLEKRNIKRFNEEITDPTGTKLQEINPRTFPKVYENLENKVEKIFRNEQVTVDSIIWSKRLTDFLPYQRGTIQQALLDIDNGLPIKGKQWHEIRSELSRRAAGARESNPVLAQDLYALIDQWDTAAQGQLSGKAANQFAKWREQYTAFKDIDEAIFSNKTAYNRYLEGRLSPEDLMSAIRQRRPTEARAPFAGRPQTTTAALGTGLDLLGYTEPTPINVFSATPRIAAGVAAKPLQAGMYSPLGQYLLRQGLPTTGVAPYMGLAQQRQTKQ